MQKTALFLIIVSLTGCVSPSMGRVARYDAHGQQVICWEPSKKFNGLVAMIASKLEVK